MPRGHAMVRIITDTTACLPSDFAQEHRISVIPQIVSFGDESFYEGLEIDQATFLQRLKSSAELPKTAAPPPELFVKETAQISAGEEAHLLVMHADVLNQAQALASELQTCLGLKDLAIFDLPPAIVVHGGPGLLGVAFFVPE